MTANPTLSPDEIEREIMAHDTWFRSAAINGQPISTKFAWLARAFQGQTISDDERAKVRAAALEEAAKIVEGQCLIYMAKVHTDEEATALVNELCQDKADIIRSLIDKPNTGEVG